MPRSRIPRYQAEQVAGLLQHLFASSRIRNIALVVLVLTSFGLFVNAVGNLLSQVPWFVGLRNGPLDFVLLLLFPTLLVGLWSWARRAHSRVNLEVLTDDSPPKAKGLVLFLSSVGRDADLLQKILAEQQTFDICNPDSRAQFQVGWRMSLEAIAYHLERLQAVIVISSCDLKSRDGSFQPGTGTRSLVEHFITLVKGGVPASRRKQLQMWEFYQAASEHEPKEQINPAWEHGVSFESVKDLVDAVELSYQVLGHLKVPAYDVLVDVTGGQKPSTAAGCAVALAEGRRFQYVSMHDYGVRSYDVTYLL